MRRTDTLPTPSLPPAPRRDGAGVLYYTFEFTIEKTGPGGFFRHNVSVLAARPGYLLTLNAQCPQAAWERELRGLLAAADSFRLRAVPPARRRRQIGPM